MAMRTFLLLLLAFKLSFIFAQNTGESSECRAAFKYELNTQIMSVVPATAINFYDASYGEAVEWHWDFGDENTSTEQNPLHIYVLPFFNDSMKVKINPYRTVILRVVTADGCSSEYSEVINIYDPFPDENSACRAAYKYYQLSYDSVQQTATFQFNNYSEGNDLIYEWKFGDGYSSTEAEPSFAFDFSQPERKVCLKVTSASGCSDIFCDAVYINQSGEDPVQPADTFITGCYAAFKYDVNYDYKTFAPALVLNFYSKAYGNVSNYSWDFGDGTSSDEANPIHVFNLNQNTDSVINDVYPFRKVCLTITTVDGCESSYCEEINVYDYNWPVDACDASFKYFIPDDIITIPEVVPYRFFATGKNIVAWNWYFEDGTESHEAEPIMYFDIFKEKQQVCLSIETADGCNSKWCETIYLRTNPVDTVVHVDPSCGYSFKYTSSFPVEASACLGKVKAQVVFGDSLIETEYYYWTTPDGKMIEGQELTNLCPTQTYTITALTLDGCKFSESFVFNSDGTVTKAPINWWIDNSDDKTYIRYSVPDSSYSVEWILCDGTVVSANEVLYSQIDCGTGDANLILKDSWGNVVYTQAIGNKTGIPETVDRGIVLYPNPVNNILYLKFDQSENAPYRYEIARVNGTLIKQGTLSNNGTYVQSIDVSLLERGIYIACIYLHGEKNAKFRFIK